MKRAARSLFQYEMGSKIIPIVRPCSISQYLVEMVWNNNFAHYLFQRISRWTSRHLSRVVFRFVLFFHLVDMQLQLQLYESTKWSVDRFYLHKTKKHIAMQCNATECIRLARLLQLICWQRNTERLIVGMLRNAKAYIYENKRFGGIAIAIDTRKKSVCAIIRCAYIDILFKVGMEMVKISDWLYRCGGWFVIH